MLQQVVAEGDMSDSALESLAAHRHLMEVRHGEHSRHEDLVIFRTYDELFPGVAKPSCDEHEAHHEVSDCVRECETGIEEMMTAWPHVEVWGKDGHFRGCCGDRLGRVEVRVRVYRLG